MSDKDLYGDLALGKHTHYDSHYDPGLLQPISRELSRRVLGLGGGRLPFEGGDVWTAYELSWLDARGLPRIACAEFFFPADSTAIIESKSFKLYLNALNFRSFSDTAALRSTLVADLSAACGAPVEVSLLQPSQWAQQSIQSAPGICLDSLDIAVSRYEPAPDCLVLDSARVGETVEEQLHSDLLRSLCPVTAQPDWASLLIRYRGAAISHEGLLAYIASFRSHQGFHEQCVEMIFQDIMQRLQPEALSVYARYLRRGGLDINPYRSHGFSSRPPALRLWRQ